MSRTKKEPDFEQALAELEQLVERMEDGELSLEESIKTYERGVVLGRTALAALDAAEQRVRVLGEDDDTSEESAAENENDGDRDDE